MGKIIFKFTFIFRSVHILQHSLAVETSVAELPPVDAAVSKLVFTDPIKVIILELTYKGRSIGIAEGAFPIPFAKQIPAGVLAPIRKGINPLTLVFCQKDISALQQISPLKSPPIESSYLLPVEITPIIPASFFPLKVSPKTPIAL